jgi:hypothetical protein
MVTFAWLLAEPSQTGWDLDLYPHHSIASDPAHNDAIIIRRFLVQDVKA